MTSDTNKEQSSKKKASPQERLEELIQLIFDTANIKGWTHRLEAKDQKNFRYATVTVSRNTNYQEITGTLEITNDGRVRVSPQCTSFYSYGFNDLVEAISNEIRKLPWLKFKKDDDSKNDSVSISTIEIFLRRFHKVARQLRNRYADRPAFLITDEYDLQDILHSFLRGLFDDIRAEEYTPSYAGGASRMDFLLKAEKIVIETKITSERLKDKQIGEQLLIDINRYKVHPDCKNLICFVYDPGANLKNPQGLETDLSKNYDNLEVKVIIVSP